MDSGLKCRVHGEASASTLVYLPGVHGDWTLVTSFRSSVAGRVRFVEFCYPRATEGSLADLARLVREALRREGIREGWLLAESFGSQLAWALLDPGSGPDGFRPKGIILAGGFVRYPFPWLLPPAIWFARLLPEVGLRWFLAAYSKVARFRHRHAPETLDAIGEFVAGRLHPGDREAVVQRLRWIAESDPRAAARAFRLPLWNLTGFWDPIVPWPPVRRWIRRQCPGWRGDRILFAADHTVLATQPQAAAAVVLDWMSGDRPVNPAGG